APITRGLQLPCSTCWVVRRARGEGLTGSVIRDLEAERARVCAEPLAKPRRRKLDQRQERAIQGQIEGRAVTNGRFVPRETAHRLAGCVRLREPKALTKDGKLDPLASSVQDREPVLAQRLRAEHVLPFVPASEELGHQPLR